jgi:hypothetical protein
LWCVEYDIDILEEGYTQESKLREIDAGHKFLQILADPFEGKTFEEREDKGCQGRQTSASPVRARSRGLEFKQKSREAGQRGEDGDHCVG